MRTDCEGIQTVRRSPRHSAVAENISIGLWCWKGVTNSIATVFAAASSPACRSPLVVTMPGLSSVAPITKLSSGSMWMIDGSSAYSTSIRSEARLAAAAVSATT